MTIEARLPYGTVIEDAEYGVTAMVIDDSPARWARFHIVVLSSNVTVNYWLVGNIRLVSENGWRVLDLAESPTSD